jgi:FKBP-type peptidyl-prolyl cis-trans isomerase FklB
MKPIKMRNDKWLKMITLSFIICHLSFCFSACSEDDDETSSEYEDWEARNDVFFAALEDSLANGSGTWMKFKCYSKDPSFSVGSNLDYIYAKVVPTGYERPTETESPLFNDSVRISYEGRLIPTASEPEGKIFDSTVFGSYNLRTNATRRMRVSSLVEGLSTALIRMHRFDTWRIYVPWKLGYGSSDDGSIPGYSTLIFTVTLYDIAAEGYSLPNQVGVN